VTDETWEQDKPLQIEQLNKISEGIQEMGNYLSQAVGYQGNTIHGKINAILDMLVNCGVITERQLMAMELKFAKEVEEELSAAIEDTRSKISMAKLAGKAPRDFPMPPPPRRNGLIKGKG